MFENGMHWVKEDSWWVVKRYEKVSSWEGPHLLGSQHRIQHPDEEELKSHFLFISHIKFGSG